MAQAQAALARAEAELEEFYQAGQEESGGEELTVSTLQELCKEREEALSVLEAKADALWEKIEEEILKEIGAAEEENGSLTEAQKEEIRTRIEEENARELAAAREDAEAAKQALECQSPGRAASG